MASRSNADAVVGAYDPALSGATVILASTPSRIRIFLPGLWPMGGRFFVVDGERAFVLRSNVGYTKALGELWRGTLSDLSAEYGLGLRSAHLYAVGRRSALLRFDGRSNCDLLKRTLESTRT